MPNWVKNIIHITGPAEDITNAIDLMRDKEVEGDIDFNNIIPMPERLEIVAGGYDKDYVALYLKTLDKSEIARLQAELHKRPVSFYKTYLRKYAESFTIAAGFKDIPDEILKRMQDNIEHDYKTLGSVSMEDIGKAYIDNILEYGHDTWYEWHTHNWGTKWNADGCNIGDDYLEFNTAWDPSIPVTVELSRRFPNLKFFHEWADEGLYRCGKSEICDGIETEFVTFEDTEEMHEFACMLWGYDPDEEDE